ncbi:MAG: 16S rRNA (uracil(1498)-N(3))-methyltransferase [Rhodospirillales bacterium]
MTTVNPNFHNLPRLFIEQPLAAGRPVALGAFQANYLGNVMRLGAGDEVLLFNGGDGEWTAWIGRIGKKKGDVVVKEQTRPQEQEAGPWLVFAPLKKPRTAFLVEKATELGVFRLCPVFTRHTNSARINPERMRAHAIEAAEQCRRLSVPDIEAIKPLAQFIDAWPHERRFLVLDETGVGAAIAEHLSSLKVASSGLSFDCGFLCGPEGGFEEGELDALRALDFASRVDLGPRILRAETAALSALACWQAFATNERN